VKDLRLTEVVRRVIDILGLRHIDRDRVAVVRNLDSSSYAYARIYALPRPIAIAFDIPPIYAIEVIARRFSSLSCREKLKVLVHELMHIPTTFSGALRPHSDRHFDPRYIDRLVDTVLERYPEICRELDSY